MSTTEIIPKIRNLKLNGEASVTSDDLGEIWIKTGGVRIAHAGEWITIGDKTDVEIKALLSRQAR